MSDAGRASGTDGQSTRDIAELVRSIATVMHMSDVSELDLDVAGLKLRLRRAPCASNGGSDHLSRSDSTPILVPTDELFISAPMIGTYYASPNPGTPPFIAVGDAVQIGQP